MTAVIVIAIGVAVVLLALLVVWLPYRASGRAARVRKKNTSTERNS